MSRPPTEEADPTESDLPTPEALDRQYHSVRQIRDRYPLIRDDHLRYLEKWSLVRPVAGTGTDRYYGFQDLRTIRGVSEKLEGGVPFRVVLRALGAAHEGQLTLDFSQRMGETQPVKVVALTSRRAPALEPTTAPIDVWPTSTETATWIVWKRVSIVATRLGGKTAVTPIDGSSDRLRASCIARIASTSATSTATGSQIWSYRPTVPAVCLCFRTKTKPPSGKSLSWTNTAPDCTGPTSSIWRTSTRTATSTSWQPTGRTKRLFGSTGEVFGSSGGKWL